MTQPTRISRLWSLKYLVLATVFSTVTLLLFLRRSSFYEQIHRPSLPTSPQTQPHYPSDEHGFTHPIGQLILRARDQWSSVLAKESHDLPTAAYRYRERRGRHPPPGFDAWVNWALHHEAVIIEDFFDRIYDDLNPFWALDAREVRYRSSHWNHEHVISIRNGKASFKGHDVVGWLPLWHGLIQELAEYLPDVDLPMNVMDESRILVKWETVNSMLNIQTANRRMPPVSKVQTSYTGLPPLDSATVDKPYEPEWITGDSNHYWDLFRQTCAPNSPSRNVSAIDVYQDPPDMPTTHPAFSYNGYVSNWTLSKDPCQYPALRSLHGTFIESVSINSSQDLVPLFGGSKLPTNNDILIPPAMYLVTELVGIADFSGGGNIGPPWAEKKDGVIWRGVASGGRNKPETWQHFHRHRLVQMLNGSTVSSAELADSTAAQSFSLPNQTDYPLRAATAGGLGPWISNFSDVGFIHLECFPRESDPDRVPLCSYTDPFFEVKPGMPMPEMFVVKYLPDIDGNSFSGRFRAFLRSTSLTIKATIYDEWHDARLMPWVHFVPMDNTFVDLYAILDFFMGYHGEGRHDSLAEEIADEGRSWTDRVLRREDMALYMWRLILEWARVCDDKRDVLGWVDDLKEAGVA